MRLKRLELVGFKSFADRTGFDFDEGLTAFVGPNGCGKSNIVDAFLWVLGEQRPTALRAKEMGDLIYAGENGRGPMGFCETSLVLSNGSGEIPLEVEEVSITRRLYRTGESEYLLNGNPCRLKDIRDILMGTGLGVDAYSVVPQGKVDILLQANPRDRRAIIEEAAGVSKYKSRRAECLRRLENVEQDLLRINDVIAEVLHQLRSVKLQAAKARRYREYTLQLTDLEISLALHRLHLLNLERSQVLDELERIQAEESDLRAQLEALTKELRGLEAQIAEKDRVASAANADLVALETEIRAANDKLEISRQRIAELDETESRSFDEVEELNCKIGSLQTELATLIQELDLDSAALIDAKARLEENLRQAQDLEAQKHAAEEKLVAAREEVFSLLQVRSRLNNDLSAVTAERRTLLSRAQRLREKQTELRQELKIVADRQANLQAGCQDAQSNISACQGELAKLSELRSAIESELASVKRSIDSRKSELERLRSRKELLEDLERKQEGVKPAVRAALEESKKPDAPVSGIVGIVADLLEVDIARAKAVEALLGEAAEAIVTRTLEDARRLASFLRQRSLGGAWIIPMDWIRGTAAQPSSLREGISSEDQFKPLLGALLRESASASNLDDAVAKFSSSQSPLRFVTPDGDLVEPEGMIKLGGGKVSGIISRRSELRKLQDDITAAEVLLTRLDEDAARKASELDHARAAEEQLRSQQSKWESTLSQLDRELAVVRARSAELEDTLNVNASELRELEEAITHANETESQIRADVAANQEQEALRESHIRELAAAKDEAESRLSALSGEVTRLKVELAQREERKGAAESRIESLKETLADQQRGIARAQAEIERCTTRRAALRDEVSSVERYLAGTGERRVALQSRIDQSKRDVEALQAQAAQLRQSRDQREQAREALANQREELRLRSSELRLKMESLCERTQTDHSRDLLELYQHYEEPQEKDWAAVEAEAADVRRKRESIGNVNLEAIAEQDRLQERFDFLSKQREDLESASSSIRNTLTHLDATCRKLFSETFDQVKANFQEMFRKLFGGGKAELVLEEGADILEAGIDIIACPPGKNPKSITLLSGGEKALTAVALLFAVFRAKAAPFCILDEVDAALDENNVERFATILKEFLSRSQFIIITHCKRTMAIADLLYGITMQEAGVSKTISMEVKKLGEGEAA